MNALKHGSVKMMLKHGLQFSVVALGAAVLLTVAYLLTHDRIVDAALAAERRMLNDVLPAPAHDNDLLTSRFSLDPSATAFRQIALLKLSTSRDGYRATLQGQTSGVIIPVETTGFSDDIALLVGIDTDGNITGARVLQHRETRGLGDKIDEDVSPWILAFDNRSLRNTPTVLWQVKKDGGDFDQFVGATITPRAVVAAIHDALIFFDLNRELLLAE